MAKIKVLKYEIAGEQDEKAIEAALTNQKLLG